MPLLRTGLPHNLPEFNLEAYSMKLNLRLLPLAIAAIGLFVATSAKADTVNFSVWENGITNLQPTPPPGSSVYGTTPTVTGSVSNSNPLNLFSFTSGTDLSLNGFLTAGGDSVVYNTGASASGDSINQSVFEFSGSAELQAGVTYSFTKDDGMILVVNGVTVINAGNATAADTVSFTQGTSGVYNFQLYYDETNGPPAVLTGNLGAAPEPSSFLLLGSSLLGAAGMLRRRMKS
jgi:hypothetical protein